MELPFLSPSPRARRVRGDGQKNLVLATRFFAPELCQATERKPPRKNKRGAERRQTPTKRTAPRAQTLPPEPAPGAARATQLRRYRRTALRARSPLGAPPRHSPRLLPLGSAPAPRFLESPGANGRT